MYWHVFSKEDPEVIYFEGTKEECINYKEMMAVANPHVEIDMEEL